MPDDFSNAAYLWKHLPAHIRRGDVEQAGILERFLTPFGGKLDEYDDLYDGLSGEVNPASASPAFLDYWPLAFFGWAYWPWWFTDGDKARVYENFGGHLAWRGTARGIERFLADFGITAVVTNQEAYVDDVFLDVPTSWGVDGPLIFVIEILRIESHIENPQAFLDDAAADIDFASEGRGSFTPEELDVLINYQLPVGQQALVVSGG